ncbi:hypothetical protein [Nocardioides sp. SR21]|uniref:hypothetical protein n=1 Tax=Nocardioides sp. SR21 TaxID=2919501 RepID=UPI001FAA743C|nr:hypothetical protein [Nocardioides sp. SR21]
MNLMLMTAIAVSVAGAIAFLATATATPGRSEERRRRYVNRHPGLVNLGDVERRLADELPAHHHDFVLTRIARQKIDAHTLWAWLDRFGAETLVLALAADCGYAGLLRRLRGDDLDRSELEVFAGFNHPELFALRNRTFV